MDMLEAAVRDDRMRARAPITLSNSLTLTAPGPAPSAAGAAPSGKVHRGDLLAMIQDLTLRMKQLETEVSELKDKAAGSDSGSESDSDGEDDAARTLGLLAPGSRVSG